MKSKRKHITPEVEKDVLVRCQRRCCLCYLENEDLSCKIKGQIAHIDKDSSNNSLENLVWLCFDHHDTYDSRTSQSKGITPKELKYYQKIVCDLYEDRQNKGSGIIQISKGNAENHSYVLEGLKNLIRIDFLILPEMSVFGTYSIMAGYSEKEQDRLSFGFIGNIDDHLLHVEFPSHRLPYPTDPANKNNISGKATWTLKNHDGDDSVAILTYGRNHITMDWHEYVMELKRLAMDTDENDIF